MHQPLEEEYRILKSKYPCFVPQHRASRDPGMDLTCVFSAHILRPASSTEMSTNGDLVKVKGLQFCVSCSTPYLLLSSDHHC